MAVGSWVCVCVESGREREREREKQRERGEGENFKRKLGKGLYLAITTYSFASLKSPMS